MVGFLRLPIEVVAFKLFGSFDTDGEIWLEMDNELPGGVEIVSSLALGELRSRQPYSHAPRRSLLILRDADDDILPQRSEFEVFIVSGPLMLLSGLVD